MTATGTQWFADNLIGMLNGLATVAAEAVTPTPGRVGLVPGEPPAWDNCCEHGGQLWVRLVNVTPPPGNDPSRLPGMDPCAVSDFIATVELGIVRCAHVLNSQGQPPRVDQVTGDAEQGIRDMADLLGVLRCSGIVRSLGSWTPQGPQGGCFSGFWSFTVRLDNCLGCE